MLRRERKNTESKNARNARKMHNGNTVATLKKVVRGVRNEIAADTLAFAAGMGSAAVLNNAVCGIVNGAAKGYYDQAGVELVVRKHRWSKPERINSKALRTKVYSAEAQGWWFDPATCKKMTDAVATASVVCGAVAGTATRGIVKDALNYHTESKDFEESWDSYYEEEETAEE